MSNNLKKIIKSNVSLLLEKSFIDAVDDGFQFGAKRGYDTLRDSDSVTGDNSAAARATADLAIDKIKQGLRDLGVSANDIDDIYTMDMLKAKAFDISFKLRIKNEFTDFDEKVYVPSDSIYNLRAKVNEGESKSKNTLVLDIKDNKISKIIFLEPKQLITNLTQTNKSVKALADGKDYDVSLVVDLDEQPTEEPENKEEEVKIPNKEKFLKGNRNMQLAYLSKTFLNDGEDIWSLLNLKEGYELKSGFLDAALKQNNEKAQEYLKKEYSNIKNNDGFKSKVTPEQWVKILKDPKTIASIDWIRNTRKGIRNFLKALSKKFPQFDIGERAEAKVSKPGEAGKSMGSPGTQEIKDSVMSRLNLLLEGTLGDKADKAGFNDSLFKKNLPQFMEMLSAMYYDLSGSNLPYNKKAVLEYCKEYGCKGGSSGKKVKKTKSDDYKLKGTDYMSDYLKEEKDTKKQVVYILELGDIDTDDAGVKKKGKNKQNQTNVTGSITITNPQNNPTWFIDGLEGQINSKLKSGTGTIRRSEKTKDTYIIQWTSPNPFNIKGTDAILIKPKMDPKDFENKVNGSGVSGIDVEIGRRANGSELMDDSVQAKLTLKTTGK